MGQQGGDGQEKFRDMQEELQFKNSQLQNSEQTRSRLEQELERRQGELEKIGSLDTKITTELNQLENKMKQYQTEIETKFDHVEQMKQMKEQQMRDLQIRRSQLDKRAEVLKSQVGFLSLKYDGKKQQLRENETHSTLENAEQNIKQFEQSLCHLRSFIDSKTSESDFVRHRDAAMDMMEQVNILQSRLTKFGPQF